MKWSDNITVYNSDCLEAMKGMKDYEFDLAIVDPPYGINDTWSKSRHDTFHQKGKLHTYQNKEIPSLAYFEQLRRVSINQIIWGGNYYTEYLRPTNSWIVWNKLCNNSVNYMSDGELAWTSFKKSLKIYDHMWSGARKGRETGNKKIHPHQKPVQLYNYLLDNYTDRGNRILDTHLGSGSIAIACHSRELNLVGFEIDAEYYKESHKRFTGIASQKQLDFNG